MREVISAGTRALQIAGGNTKEAMNMVTLAEDMASLNPGKTVGDAMEAIADMNIGEMARLTEFGVKASSKDNPKAVQKQLETMYAGGAGKLADSGSGLLSTITGKLKSNIADIGQSMLEPLKPVMSNVIEFINQVTPKMLEFGTKIGEGLGKGITWITENMPTIQPIFSNIFSAIQTVVTTVTPIIGQALVALGPVFTGLLSVAGVAMKGISGVVQAVAPIVSSLINALKPVFKNVGSALENMGKIFKSVFDGIKSVVEKAYNFVKPLIDGIGNAVSGISGAVSSGLGWIASKVGKNATGTKYWRGGLSVVGEHGPELVQMPSGSKVYTNTETNSILNSDKQGRQSTNTGTTVDSSITIAKIADTIVVREESDIDKIANAIVSKLQQRRVAFGG